MTATTLNRTRRRSELALGLLVVVVTGGGYILVALSDGPELPADLWAFLASVLGLYVVAHFAVRRLAPGADATLLPLAAALNGIGFVTISRLDRELARIQAGWVAIGVIAFVVTLLVVRNTRLLEKYRYTFALLGVGFLLLPLLPGIGRTINGARLWVSIGPLNFQPGEIAKVLLVIFFAAYLADNRELLAAGSVRVGRFFVPALRHLGPLALAWGFSILVMVYEKDLGSSLLFFGVFAAMLYMATGRAVLPVRRPDPLPDRRRDRVRRVRARAGARRHVARSVERPGEHRLPDHPVLVRVRYGRVRRNGPRSRQPRQDPERGDRLRVLRDR